MANKEKIIVVTSFDPLRILQIIDDDEYEEMIEEWQRDFLGKKYDRVERLGGTDDKGRDVVCKDKNGDLHIFQCKHYDRKLTKQDVLREIGKCCYYCFKGDYPIPKKHYLVSPQGLTTPASDLFVLPSNLKKELLENWKKTCQSKICSQEVVLDNGLQTFIEGLDFSIFNYITPNEFLEDFKKTAYYTKRFGQLRKPRELINAVPEEIQPNELIYIRKILDAYGEYLGNNIEDAKKLEETDPRLWEDFNRQRLYFYSAEYLAAYSRETYPPESHCFEQLKEEIYHGIIYEIQEDAKNGFERLRKVLNLVGKLMINQTNPLTPEVNIKDRRGICHHLANERGDIQWKKQN